MRSLVARRHADHDPPVGLRVDERAARAVAECFLASGHEPAHPIVRSAYRELEAQTDALLGRLLRPRRRDTLRVVSTEIAAPYDSDQELIRAVSTTGTLEVPVVERDRRHPLLDSRPGGAYDRFRAVHDLLGHVLHGFGFDRDGEFAAWIAQDRHHRGLARAALATELHAHHSVRWSTGQFAEPKATLIDPRLLRASVAASVGAARRHRAKGGHRHAITEEAS
jgi:hypothetical protein